MIVSRVRVTTDDVDAYGNPSPASETTTAISGAHVWPATSTDTSDYGRTGVIVGLTLWVPAGFDLRATDEVVVDGERFRIVGDAGAAAEYRSPFTGWNPGSTVSLERVEG